MKRFHGKIVMAAIILSCGLVMQVEQSERSASRQADQEAIAREVALNTYHPDREARGLEMRGERGSR